MVDGAVGTNGSGSGMERTCQYLEGGYCLTHGEGAMEKFRGGYKLVKGRGGKIIKKYQREKYFVCDLGRGGRGGKLRQTRLSFVQKTSSNEAEDAISLFDTSTVGQNKGKYDTGVASREKDMIDEN